MDTTNTVYGWPPKILMILFVAIIVAFIVTILIVSTIVKKCQNFFQDREARSNTWPFRMCFAKNRV